ncbi:hypothetical protein QTP88_025892 [Uroleucon formosanum]
MFPLLFLLILKTHLLSIDFRQAGNFTNSHMHCSRNVPGIVLYLIMLSNRMILFGALLTLCSLSCPEIS